MVTTFDSSDNHEVAPGTGFDGVPRLELNFTGPNQGTCTGTLLTTGFHVLTAAHCFTGAETPDLIINEVVVDFDLAGSTPMTVFPEAIHLHPGWQGTGDYKLGFDLAVLALPAAAPAQAERYELYRDSDEIGQLTALVGWGTSGQGVEQAALYPRGVKRSGINRYERFDDRPSAGDIILAYDFDNNNAANDYFGLTGGPADLGEGDDEVMIAPGDSGGPSFIGGNVAGVHSFRQPDPQNPSNGIGDSVPGFNSSFGEYGGDTRVSWFADWIDDAIGPPRIIGVTVSGTNPADAPYPMPSGSGAQIDSIPVSGIDTLTVHFNEDVNISSQAFKLTSALDCDQETGVCETYPLDATFDGDNGEPEDGGGLDYEFDPTTGESTATFKLAEPFDSPFIGDASQPGFDQVVLSILAQHVTDNDANQLDGDWMTNPTSITQSNASAFPSGNWSAGGDFDFYMTIMPGDHNFSSGFVQNKIEQADLDAVLQNWGQTNQTFKNGDGTGDGFVAQGDLDQVILSPNWGMDWQNWQGGGGMQMLSGGGSTDTLSDRERREDVLDALFDSLTRNGMEEVWKALHVNEDAVVASDGSWAAFVNRLGRALDDFWGVDSD